MVKRALESGSRRTCSLCRVRSFYGARAAGFQGLALQGFRVVGFHGALIKGGC